MNTRRLKKQARSCGGGGLRTAVEARLDEVIATLLRTLAKCSGDGPLRRAAARRLKQISREQSRLEAGHAPTLPAE